MSFHAVFIGHAIHQRGTSEEQVPVLMLRDLHGGTTDFKLTLVCQREEAPILSRVIGLDSVLCIDGGASPQGARAKPVSLIAL